MLTQHSWQPTPALVIDMDTVILLKVFSICTQCQIIVIGCCGLQILFWKKRAEEELQRSGLEYTIVRPGDFMHSCVNSSWLALSGPYLTTYHFVFVCTLTGAPVPRHVNYMSWCCTSGCCAVLSVYAAFGVSHNNRAVQTPVGAVCAPTANLTLHGLTGSMSSSQ